MYSHIKIKGQRIKGHLDTIMILCYLTMYCSWDGLPALAAVHVAADVLSRDAGPGAVTHLTAHQGMAAECLWLTLHTLGQQRTWRTDTLACHWLTQACATIACYKYMDTDSGKQGVHTEVCKQTWWAARGMQLFSWAIAVHHTGAQAQLNLLYEPFIYNSEL